MKKKEVVKVLSNEKFDVQILDLGIIENVVKEGVVIEKKDVLQLIKVNKTASAAKKHCVLITSNSFASITQEARKLSAGRKKVKVNDTIAKAVVVNNLGHRLVGNFYVQVNRPNIKTKIFSDRNKAIVWLKRQLNHSK